MGQVEFAQLQEFGSTLVDWGAFSPRPFHLAIAFHTSGRGKRVFDPHLSTLVLCARNVKT